MKLREVYGWAWFKWVAMVAWLRFRNWWLEVGLEPDQLVAWRRRWKP